eukprot:gene7454-5251_t
MFRLSCPLFLLIHSPKGVGFTISADEAISNIKKKYGKRWFGADLQYLSIATPSREFVPFYLASGTVEARFTGQVRYASSSSSSDKGSSSHETYVETAPQLLNTTFQENRTQVYGGFKYHIGHMHAVMRSEATPLLMQKMSAIDTRGAEINLFEQSTLGVRGTIQDNVRAQVYELAKERVKSFHPTAESVDVNFDHLQIRIAALTPVFLPCYVVKATYDDVRYTLYVSGRFGTVGGPYLLNQLRIARVAAGSVAALSLLVMPNKIMALLYGSVMSAAAYVAAYYGARYLPLYRRNRNRNQREALRQAYLKATATMDDAQRSQSSGNYHPTPEAQRQRVKEEYRASSYWDSHPYQREGPQHGPLPRDAKGYYRLLGLRGDESVNEIRSAYRKVVLVQHPDMGGNTEKMAEINAAYRVLRDPQRRREYDALQ